MTKKSTLPAAEDATYGYELLNDEVTPKEFDLDEYISYIQRHHRLRRQSSTHSGERYILYIVDTSGSIGYTGYDEVVKLLAELIPLFCGNIKVAVMSYSTEIHHEICFNCNQSDRHQLKLAVEAIRHHSAMTHSGEAIQCACDYMLSSQCGFPTITSPPVDVIFLTDGRSNGPKKVCDATKCLNRFDSSVFAIGIGATIDYDELYCIVGANRNNDHILTPVNIKDITALKQLRDAIILEVIEKHKICTELDK